MTVIESMLATLSAGQWKTGACPMCGNAEATGHAAGCVVAMFIAQLTAAAQAYQAANA